MDALVRLDDVTKRYDDDGRPALDRVSLEIGAGEAVAIMGPSGSGKSTLLNLIAGLDRPTSGAVSVAGTRIDQLGETGTALFRRNQVGMIFQFFNLLDDLTVADNVLLPAQLGGMSAGKARARADELLEVLHIERLRDAYPARLSGGERQRVAIARALVNQPALLLADEPTGALDSATGEEIGALLSGLHRSGLTLVLVTHNPELAARYAERTVELVDGRIAGSPLTRCTRWPDDHRADLQGRPWRDRPPAPADDRRGARRARLDGRDGARAGARRRLERSVRARIREAARRRHRRDGRSGVGVSRVLARTATLPEVTAAAGPFAEVTVSGRSAGQELPPQTIVGRATPGGPVDDLVLEAGHWATKPGQVVLATGGENDLRFSLGSLVTVGTAPHRQTLTVVGLANSITGTASGWVAPAEIPLLRAAGGTSATQMLYRFAQAGIGAQLHADVARLTGVLPRGALAGTMSYYTAKIEEDGNIAPFVPFLLAFGILGIVMSVLIVANVVGGAVVAGYRRIGILKSLGFTPAQVALTYAAQVALPALVGCLIGVGLGNLIAAPLLRQNANAYGVGHLGVPIWVDVVVPAAICALAALAALLPALRAGRLSTVQAIATGRAPQSGRGYAAHRLFGRMPLPRPITIGLAAPFARPSRTLLTLAAVLLGATTVTFAVGLTSSLKLVVDGISHQQAEPVQIQMPGNGFAVSAPDLVGPKHIKAGPPTRGPQVPTAKAEHAILAAVHSQPATLHVVAQADNSASVAGLSEQVPVTAFRGPATWTGYDLVSGHWYGGPDQVLAPTGFLTQTGTSVGDTITVSQGGRRERVRIVGEVFDTRNRGISMITSWSTLARHIDPGIAPDQFDVGLRSGTSASAYANALNRRLGPNYGVELNTRKTAVVNAMIGLIGTLAALLAAVAALGVLNTVVLETRERVHDIGIFKAVGMTPRQTIAMAVCWVAGIGLVAGVLAVPIGVALHHEILPAMAGSVGLRLPASFLTVYSAPELVALALAGVLIAVLGALAPAGWAAKSKTANALHAE